MFVHGYPVERFRTTENDGRPNYLSSGIGYLTGTLDVSEIEARFKPHAANDTFLAWPRDEDRNAPEGWLRRAPNAKGISGAGVWMIGNSADIWMPTSSRMVAVEHSWVEGAWLRGTQVQHWLRMLVEDVPDVAGAVLRAFPTL